jgi:hypothetical protein
VVSVEPRPSHVEELAYWRPYEVAVDCQDDATVIKARRVWYEAGALEALSDPEDLAARAKEIALDKLMLSKRTLILCILHTVEDTRLARIRGLATDGPTLIDQIRDSNLNGQIKNATHFYFFLYFWPL